MRYAYPILLDLKDRPIVLIGGGAVAVRKARGLTDAGANRLRCVALKIDAEMPPVVERVVASYGPDHLNGARLVFALTDQTTINDQVVRDAQRRGLLVCRGDAAEALGGDFVTPARYSDGELVLAVSAGGAGLSAFVRDRIAGQLDTGFAELAGTMRMLRQRVQRMESFDASQRRELFRAIATDQAMRIHAEHGRHGLIRWLAERWPILGELEND